MQATLVLSLMSIDKLRNVFLNEPKFKIEHVFQVTYLLNSGELCSTPAQQYSPYLFVAVGDGIRAAAKFLPSNRL